MAANSFYASVVGTLKKIGLWGVNRILAPIVAFLIVMAFALGLFFLAKKYWPENLWHFRPTPKPDQSNTVLPNRIHPDGNPIPIGVPDINGQTQVPVAPLPNQGGVPEGVIRVNTPGKSPVEVALPIGINPADVTKVEVITPVLGPSKVEDKSDITLTKIDALLGQPSPQDTETFLALLRERKCRLTQAPVVHLDPITLTTDKDGRVFVSGGDPTPYRVSLSWCGTEVETTGKLDVAVTQRQEPTWGPTFRLKAGVGYIPVPALAAKDGWAGLDIGLLVEPFFYQAFSLNVYTGVRAVGIGIGYDVTRTVTLYGGYAATFPHFEASPHLAAGFALW
jgi:hypothetical protein